MNEDIKNMLTRPFDRALVKERIGPGGRTLSYVAIGDYVSRLNEALEFHWSHEITEVRVLEDEVIVQVKLTAAGVHISIQRNHVHLLVQADHKVALSRGMQSFQISAAKHVNRALSVKSLKNVRRLAAHAPRGDNAERLAQLAARTAYRTAMAKRRRGPVFPDRFHQEVITSPRQARRALAYVMNNWRKHREDCGQLERTWNVDPYSTGVLFDGWKEREHELFVWRWRDSYDPLVVYFPRTWLLREGRRAGLVGFREVPGGKQLPAEA